MDKKAQGLSLNTIIIAIIVLIVLVVIIMVFTGYFGTRFTPGVTSCVNAGGTCETKDDDGCGFDAFGTKKAEISGSCPNAETQICCAKGLGSGEAPVDTSNCGEKDNPLCPGSSTCNTGLVPQNGVCVEPTPTCTAAGGTCQTVTACPTGTTPKVGTGCTTGQLCCG